MSYITLEDGSLLFETPVSFVTTTYYQDPKNPYRYIPKYEPCLDRRIQLRTLSCGRRVGIWKCDQFNKTTSVPECKECNARRTE